MIDNLTESIDLPEQEKRLHMSNPYRHDASMTILLCVEGTVDFSIGLSSYRMNANERRSSWAAAFSVKSRT